MHVEKIRKKKRAVFFWRIFLEVSVFTAPAVLQGGLCQPDTGGWTLPCTQRPRQSSRSWRIRGWWTNSAAIGTVTAAHRTEYWRRLETVLRFLEKSIPILYRTHILSHRWMIDLSARLGRCKIFIKLDIQQGYHQIPVHPVQKLSIITPFERLSIYLHAVWFVEQWPVIPPANGHGASRTEWGCSGTWTSSR